MGLYLKPLFIPLQFYIVHPFHFRMHIHTRTYTRINEQIYGFLFTFALLYGMIYVFALKIQQGRPDSQRHNFTR